MSEVDEATRQPMFATEAERDQAAVALGVSVSVLPAAGVVIGAVEAERAVDEPPVRLTDAEWELIQPVLDQWKGIKLSRVEGRRFIDYCLEAARLQFHWALLETEPDAEACRKRAERMCLAAENRWAELLESVADQMRPEVAMLLNAWVARGDTVRARTLQQREQRRKTANQIQLTQFAHGHKPPTVHRAD